MEFDLATHTPGPWRIGVGGLDDGRRSLTVDRMSVYSVETNHPNGYWASIWAVRETDARLIAAAPDLLEALEASWPGIVGDDTQYDRPIQEVHAMVRAAIAKTTGSPGPASLPLAEKG